MFIFSSDPVRVLYSPYIKLLLALFIGILHSNNSKFFAEISFIRYNLRFIPIVMLLVQFVCMSFGI